jgi:hypothetical protein
MDNSWIIRTTWGPTGPQQQLIRRPDPIRTQGEEKRSQAGKFLSSSTYGTPVPICIGRSRVPAVLIEKYSYYTGIMRLYYLIASGEINTLGRVSYNNKDLIAFEQDPAKYVPGTFAQDPGSSNGVKYHGNAVAWRDIPSTQSVPSLSYEVNGKAVNELQQVVIHTHGPSATDLDPHAYQMDSCVRGNEVHLVYVTKYSPTEWRIYYTRSLDGGFVWTTPLLAATVDHALPSPRISCYGAEGGTVHMAWFHTRNTTVTVKESYLTGVGWGTYVTRTVATQTSAQRTGLTGASHLSLSAEGGKVWIAWQCHPHATAATASSVLSVRGLEVAVCDQETTAGATWYRPPVRSATPVSGGPYPATQQLIYGAPLDDSLQTRYDLRCPSIAAAADGTAAVAFSTSNPATGLGGDFGILVLPIQLNASQVEWDISYQDLTDPGALDSLVLQTTKFRTIPWDGRLEATIYNWPDSPTTPQGWGMEPLPYSAASPRTYIQSVLRLVWLGAQGLPGQTDCYALVYSPQTMWNTSGVSPTSWRVRIGAISADEADEREFTLDRNGISSLPPAIALDTNRLIVSWAGAALPTGVAANRTWQGDAQAFRWVISWPVFQPEISVPLPYSALVAGDDERAHWAVPTKNGLVVAEWGDFDPGDADSGRYSRLTAWDPTAEDEADLPFGEIYEALTTDANFGGWPRWAAHLGNIDDVNDYCRAMGFLFSDTITSQTNLWTHLCDLAASANLEPVWSDGVLEWVPIEHQGIAGNGYSWTPATSRQTPAYHLGPADFGGSLNPGKRPESEEKNVLPIQFNDRAIAYSPNTLDLRDPAQVSLRGEQRASGINCPWITRKSVAGMSAKMRMRREANASNTWEARLTCRYWRLQPMDLVTLTDPQLGLDHETVRIRKLVRHRDKSMSVTFESAGIGYGAPTNPFGTGGDLGDTIWYAPPIIDAAIQVMPEAYIGDGQKRVLMIAAGIAAWNGCEVWRRWSGGDWAKIGSIAASSPIGALKEPMGKLSPRPGLRPHPGLRCGAQDDWTADMTQAGVAVPTSTPAYFLSRPPVLTRIGGELMVHWEASTVDGIGRGKTLQRAVQGSTFASSHDTGEQVAVFGDNRFEWIPDGTGDLEIKFPAAGGSGTMDEPLSITRTYVVTV